MNPTLLDFTIAIQVFSKGFPGDSVVKKSPANAGVADSVPGSGKSPGEGNGNPTPCNILA